MPGESFRPQLVVFDLAGTTLGQAVADAERTGMEPPAIICVGRSVLMRQVLDWQALAAGVLPRDLDPLGRGRPAESA